jgi:hypothetical protein
MKRVRWNETKLWDIRMEGTKRRRTPTRTKGYEIGKHGTENRVLLFVGLKK